MLLDRQHPAHLQRDADRVGEPGLVVQVAGQVLEQRAVLRADRLDEVPVAEAVRREDDLRDGHDGPAGAVWVHVLAFQLRGMRPVPGGRARLPGQIPFFPGARTWPGSTASLSVRMNRMRASSPQL